MLTQPRHDDRRILYSAALPDGPAELVRYPGVPGFNDAHHALFAAMRRTARGSIFVAGPGSVATTLWVARTGSTLHHFTDSIAEAQSMKRTLSLNALAEIPSITDWSADDLHCDLALVHLPRGRELQREYLRFTAYHLVPGGKLMFVGAKNEGIRTAVDDASEILGRAGVVARKGGYHVAIAYRPATPMEHPELAFDVYDLAVDGIPTHLVSCIGAFARDRLDSGAAALIEGMQIRPGSTVLDIGCGTGLVSLAAARRGAHVTATDVSYRAVASARRTLAVNDHDQVTVEHSHGATCVRDRSIDTVVTNPPFHKGHDRSFEVPQFFAAEAMRVLKPGGNLFLVANTFLDYRPYLARHFTILEPAFEDKRYRVWHAVKGT